MKTKNENVTPVRVWRNELHEANTKRELQTAQTALQSCLDVWNSLELIQCTDIFALILNPETAYKKAVSELAVVPVTVGRFQISKEAYINTLDVPIPDSLYRAAREARKVQFTNMPELWSIESDKVILNETEANQLIDSQSIYASGEKIKLAEDLTKFVDLFNSLNSRLNFELFLSSNPVTNTFFRGWGSFEETDGRGNYGKLAIIPDTLKRWLSL
jgi:hypothetical protein